jgi:hypothetical protein
MWHVRGASACCLRGNVLLQWPHALLLQSLLLLLLLLSQGHCRACFHLLPTDQSCCYCS